VGLGIKDGINIFAHKGNRKERSILQNEIDSLNPSLRSSNDNIDQANSRINSLTTENSKLYPKLHQLLH
jgi:prefoldin subunit 5